MNVSWSLDMATLCIWYVWAFAYNLLKRAAGDVPLHTTYKIQA